MLSIVRPNLSSKGFNLSRRTFRTGHPNLISEKTYQKIKLTQARMQRNDGVPVFLKCGTRDKVVYYTALVLTIGCSIDGLRRLLKFAKEY